MSLLIKSISATALLLSVNANALAATLSSVTGSVQTNRGNGFVATPAPTFLKAGDQVMAGEKSSGVIAYDNGCTVEVKAGQVVTVTDDAACKAANLNTGSTAAAGSAPIGVGAIAVGAAAIGGAAIVLSNKKSSSSP